MIASALLVLLLTQSTEPKCLIYDVPVELSGRLGLWKAGGYYEFLYLRTTQPVCGEVDPKHASPDWYSTKTDAVTMIQLWALGGPNEELLGDRLDRLVGYRVRIRGSVSPLTTGYHHTPLILSVEEIEPVEAAGRRALEAPKPPKPKLKNLKSYEATVRAGRRLVIEAHEVGSRAPLLPTDGYLSHWMTGGEVAYLNCRKGYDLKALSIVPKDAAVCDTEMEDTQCMFNAYPPKLITLRLLCTNPH